MLELVDTHAHLSDEQLAERHAEVLREAARAGVRQIVSVGTTADDSAACVGLAGAHRGVFASVGIQPNYVAQAGPGDWERVELLARAKAAVALGETGLDRYWDHTPFDQQRAYFDRHLRLAEELDLPVIIHCRDCEWDIVDQLKPMRGRVRGVLHSFTGALEHAEAFVDLGLHISFAGMLTFSNRKLDALRDVAARVPGDRLLFETDSPYLSPQPFRGQPNEPCRLVHTAAVLARLRGMEVVELAELTTRNARALFRLDCEQVLSLDGLESGTSAGGAAG